MHSYERHLPHRYVIGVPLFVTFRLYGSLPRGRDFQRDNLTSGQAFVCMDNLLDGARTGPTYLRVPEVASIVRATILEGRDHDYELDSWVIMPNHVHMLITPQCGMPEVMKRLKGTTAREANRALSLTGQPFWQREWYDHIVRGRYGCERVRRYIINNPVKAGLAPSPELFPWSSAAMRD